MVGRHWQTLARELRLEPEEVTDRIRDLAARIPPRMAEVLSEARASGLAHPTLDRIESLLPTWIAARLRALEPPKMRV